MTPDNLPPLPEPAELSPFGGWSAAQMREYAAQAVAHEQERWKPGHDRYEIVRRMNPRQFADLWQRNVHGAGQFDQLVDAIDAAKEGQA